MSPLLATDGLTAHYGDFQALFGIDFEVGAGEVVAIIGANGAGKSTFLRSICGLLPLTRQVARHVARINDGADPLPLAAAVVSE